MNYDSVAHIAATLSDQEREKFRELIGECLERERDFAETDIQVRQNLEELTRAAINLIRSLDAMEKTLDLLKNALTLNGKRESGQHENGKTPPGRELH